MIDDPYVVLGIGPEADEKQIRQRYLQLVREHPPERDPQASRRSVLRTTVCATRWSAWSIDCLT